MVEHWVCENCDSVDPPTFKGDEKACGICADEGENGLLIELVPARRLRWAEDLRAVAQSAAKSMTRTQRCCSGSTGRHWRELALCLEAGITPRRDPRRD
jgi:hypothetical protein